MPRLTIDLEDYIDEFDNDDLITELSGRKLSKEEKNQLSDILNECKSKKNYPLLTLIDEIKMDIIKKNLNSKSLEEIEQFFKHKL